MKKAIVTKDKIQANDRIRNEAKTNDI